MKKRILSAFLALTMAVTLLPAASAAATQEEMLQALAALEIMVGDETGDLGLGRQVTRAEFTKMLMSASAYRDGVGEASTSPYPDVPREHWAAGAIQAAVQAGYVTGYLDGTFRPSNTITLAEGVTMLLRLLGFDRSAGDFTGSYPSAEMNAYHALGLDEGVSASSATSLLTRKDCMYLFYNLLTATTKTGTPYLVSLGFSLTESGEVDLVSLINSAMDGPVVATGTWRSQLPFDPAQATVYRGGSLSSLSAISEGDVVYWSDAMRTLWVYTNRATGPITAISPNSSNPSSVTVGGRNYSIETAAAAYALSSLGSYRVGDTVTLLLGRDGGVAAVLSGSQTSAAGTVYGIVTAVSTDSYADENGNEYSANTITLLSTDGNTYSYPCPTTSIKAGALVQVTSSGSSTTVKRLSTTGSKLSGKVNSAATSLGNYPFADDVEILDVYYQSAARVFPSRLAGMELTTSMISWYQLNSNGEISRLILSDATGDMHTYGVLTDVSEIDSDVMMATSGSYIYDSAGVTGSFQGNRVFHVTPGPMVIQWKDGQVERMDNLTSVRLDSAAGTAAQSGNQAYLLPDSLLVYEVRGSDYYLTSLDLVNNGDYALSGYYDAQREDGVIRVILARANA